MTDAPRKRGRRTRQPLSAERIAAEAMALCDEAGFDAVSFRALAKRLGCEAMSLYHYVPSKQHLVDLMVNICLAETPVPPPGPPVRDRLRTFCYAYRATAVRHAGFAPILLTHRLNHREGLEWLDRIATMFGGPADGPTRATAFRVISYYLSGASLDEALGYARGPSAANPVPSDEAQRDFPNIVGLGAYFGKEYHDPFFEAGLDLILDWIERKL